MTQFLVPVLRASAQAAVAFVAAFLLVHFGLSVDPATQAELIGVLTAVLTGLVAKGQQWAERRFPQIGVALHTPQYVQGLNELRAAARNVSDIAVRKIETVTPAAVTTAPEAPPATP